MDFALSEEQAMLQAGAQRFVRDHYEFEKRRGLADSAEGFSREHWATFAELGWLALPFAEEHGGLGGAQVDVMLLMESLGRGLVLEPYLPTVLLAGRTIEALGSAEQIERYLSRIFEGSTLAAFAFAEPQSRYDLADVTLAAEERDGVWRLSGRKSVVIGGAYADVFVVLARTGGGQRDRAGLSCFLLPKDAEGLSVHGYRTADGGRAAELMFEDARAEALLGEAGGAYDAAATVVEGAAAALCGEAIGAMDALVEATRAYLSQRKQFGVPLAAFQALQHKLADMVIAAEQTKSLVYAANMRQGEEADIRGRAVSAAKAEVARNGAFVAATAVQLHGGMGVSEEMSVGTYFKRLNMINALFGDRAYHLRRHAALAA